QNPLGKTFQIDEPPGTPRPVYEIVGFARDSKYNDLRDPFEPLVYVPATQNEPPGSTLRLVVHSRLPLAQAAATITALAQAVHPSIVVEFRTMQSQVRDSLMRERLMATLSGFGALAALIATVGLYGV